MTARWDASAVLAQARALGQRMTEIRRDIHACPELGLNNPRTQSAILAWLERLGVASLRRGQGCTSVVADIEGSAEASQHTVLLRADTDALPLSENAQVEWASRTPGCMHACGHDAHVAMLLGAAQILQDNRERFSGRVRLVFQPGEEGFGGARIVIDEGALEGVGRAFALHVEPGRRSHLVACRRGAVLAAFDNFAVTFHGSGGHASTPHVTRDPIPAIGPFVDALAHVAARETDPSDRTVISVTKVEAGTTDNVIPPTAHCYGTIRTLSVDGRERARKALARVAAGVAATRNLEASVDLVEGYPPTINDDSVVETLRQVSDELDLASEEMAAPFMGAEDFSYVLERVPGAMAFLGARIEGGGPLHSDLMKLDEAVLPTGTAIHVSMALKLLADC